MVTYKVTLLSEEHEGIDATIDCTMMMYLF